MCKAAKRSAQQGSDQQSVDIRQNEDSEQGDANECKRKDCQGQSSMSATASATRV